MTSPAVADLVRVDGDSREVALAETQAVFAMAQDESYRGRLAGLAAALDDGEVGGSDAEELERLIELGLQSGRLRALYGPEGERAALSLYRRLPRGAELTASAREVTQALRSLAGAELHSVSLEALGPGVFTLSLVAGGTELSIRLDRQGARLASVGI
jgi:hypothetical protein